MSINRPPRKRHPVPLGLAAFCLLIAAYIAGYLVSGSVTAHHYATVREYRHGTLIQTFVPAAWFEAHVKHLPVVIYDWGNTTTHSPQLQYTAHPW